jgi:ribosome biogenesis GTPase A
MDQSISWFPGHMAKARREIMAGLKLVDGVLEVIDSRAPVSSRNSNFAELWSDIPHIIVSTKKDLSDPTVNRLWIKEWSRQSLNAVMVDLNMPESYQIIMKKIKGLKTRSNYAEQRLLIAGTPNTGKSTLINCLAKKKKSTTGALPGVTRINRWISIAEGIRLLDTPGILPPKLADVQTGYRLAWLGCIGINAYDSELVGIKLLEYLLNNHSEKLEQRYKIKVEPNAPYQEVITEIALKRGMVSKGGNINGKQCLEMLMKEFREGILGRISLERP